MIADGDIGELRAIQSFYAYTNLDPVNIRNVVEFGGGALLDIGCYCISLSRYIFDGEPNQVCAYMEIDPRFKTDRLTCAMLNFNGGISSFTCATQLAFIQKVEILGTDGRIEFPTPFIVPNDRPTKLIHYRGTDAKEISFDICNQYTIQADLFSKAIIDGAAQPAPLEDAVANMKVIDAIVHSAQNSCWV
jgi:predicted dehydrogenase